ncbi:MAG TPA: hypothetical protein VHA70_16040 [Bauldia sp.]|nr:hypothetical protein [Bauldia sp.]
MRKIEVDEETALALEKRAEESGMSVPELVAGFVQSNYAVELSEEDLAELDRRADAALVEPNIPHEEVVRWLKTWGTPDYNPWPKD